MKPTGFLPVLAALSAFSLPAHATNLFPGGDFTSAGVKIGALAFANGGKVSLFQEEFTWNKCGMLEVGAPITNKEGHVTWSATALVGSSDGKARGMAVKGGMTYDFKVELRADREIRAGISLFAWKEGEGKDAVSAKATISSVKVPTTWTPFKGSFTVPAGKTRACIRIGMWASTRHSPASIKTGDRIYFDNVVVAETEDRLAAIKGGSRQKAQPVPRVKAVASGETFGDFFVFERVRGCADPAGDAPSVHVAAEDGAIVVDVSIVDPKGISPGGKGVWAGDSVEVFFGPTCDNIDRKFTQLAWNPSGARFSKPGGIDGWKLLSNEVRGNTWKSRVSVPYGFLGFTRPPMKGESLAFNVCHSRKNAKEMRSWAKVAEAFAEVKSFGRIIIGSYADALANDWKAKEECAGRDAYEKRVSELETARRQEELDRFRDRGFTVSVVPVDSDYSVPFVPRESFSPTEKIELTAAVNERVGLPVAVLNLTDRAEEYVVRLETSTFDPDPNKPWADKQMNGSWGLKGFPASQIVARHALRFKDTDAEPVTLRLEPLPKMDEACAIHVPPKEASPRKTGGVRNEQHVGQT